jgi:hypothetical protein
VTAYRWGQDMPDSAWFLERAARCLTLANLWESEAAARGVQKKQETERQEPFFFSSPRRTTRDAALDSAGSNTGRKKPRKRSLMAQMNAVDGALEAARTDMDVEPPPTATRKTSAAVNAQPISADVLQTLYRYESEISAARLRIDNQRRRIERLENEAKMRDKEIEQRQAEIVTLQRQVLELDPSHHARGGTESRA